MRPQSALLLKQNKKINFNQQYGYYYVLNEQGQELKVNRQGQIISKFVNDFTGFYNFKERKNRSLKDKSLMYSQPKLEYNKNNGLICPKGSKFLGYAQFPYDLKGNLPQFLEENTFNQSCQSRRNQNSMVNATLQNDTPSTESIFKNNGKLLNKFKSLKILQSANQNFVSFDQVRKDRKIDSCLGSRQNLNTMKSDKKQKKSIILEACQKYGQQHRTKSVNSKSTSFLLTTSASNNFGKRGKQRRQASYFQQSLSNIQKTQTPNYLCSNLSSPQVQNFTQSNLMTSSLYQASLKSKCYKSSCHYVQYIPKRRYIKENCNNEVINMSQYQKEFETEMKENQIVKKLKDQLKIYQPVVSVVQKRQQNAKKGTKDKPKNTQAQSSNKK